MLKPIEFKNLLKGRAKYESVHEQMFCEDVINSILPYSESNNAALKISGSEENLDKAFKIFEILTNERMSQHQGSLDNLIKKLTRQLIWYGKCFFEITSESDTPLNRLNIEWYFKLIDIFIFKNQVTNTQTHPLIRYLKSNKVWVLSMPVGFRRTKLLSKLSKCDLLMPRFFEKQLSQELKTSYFNLEEYTQNQKIYFLKHTKLWGWLGRDYTERYINNFYSIYRHIKFKKTLAILRSHIIESVNKLLKQLQCNATITTKTIKTPDELNTILEQLISGEIDLKDAYIKDSE